MYNDNMSEQSSNIQEKRGEYNVDPTPMQIAAVRNWVEGGRTKGEALREAGYSEATAIKPSRVFNSAGVKAILDDAGVEIVPIIQELKSMVFRSGKIDYMVFPAFIDGSNRNPFEDEEPEDEGEQLTDEEIRQMIHEAGGMVKQIKHTKSQRHVWFFIADNKAKLEAIEKLINLHGIYAPKRTDMKVSVGVFTSFRERMEKRRKEGKIIDIGEKRDATTPLEGSENNETT
jgi:hypothetical protein